MKSAIVSTIVNADNVIDSFIKYHQIIGISHFLFFIDDNSESIINHLENNYKDITTVIKNTKELDDEYIKLNSPFFYHFRHKEVMARQILNTKYAMNLCLEKKIDWLLHIDIDELVYLPNKNNINEIFESVEEKKFDSIFFHNFEALPTNLDIKDYFKEVNLFKKNFNFFNDNQINILDTLKLVDKIFIGYHNGKSAIKIKENIDINSVHIFPIEGKIYYDLENVVLHYNCCGYNYFREKYKKLGNFSDKWFNKYQISDAVPFHLNARNIIKLNNEKIIRDFYIKEVIKFDKNTIMIFLKYGFFEIIDKPQKILEL